MTWEEFKVFARNVGIVFIIWSMIIGLSILSIQLAHAKKAVFKVTWVNGVPVFPKGVNLSGGYSANAHVTGSGTIECWIETDEADITELKKTHEWVKDIEEVSLGVGG